MEQGTKVVDFEGAVELLHCMNRLNSKKSEVKKIGVLTLHLSPIATAVQHVSLEILNSILEPQL